jgi:hypothetical protein
MNTLICEIYSCKYYSQHSLTIISTERASYLIHEVDMFASLINNRLKVAC